MEEDDVWPVVEVSREDADETNKADLVFVKVDEMHNVRHNELPRAHFVVKVCEVCHRSSVTDLGKELDNVENEKNNKEEEEVGLLCPS